MNIRIEYSAFVLSNQKNWKNQTTNLMEMILQIIRYFEFIERNKKSNKIVLQTSTSRSLAESRLVFLICKKLYCHDP